MAGRELWMEPSARKFVWTARQARLVKFSLLHNSSKSALSTTGGMQEQRPPMPGIQIKSLKLKQEKLGCTFPDTTASFPRSKFPNNSKPEHGVISAPIGILNFCFPGGEKDEDELVSSCGLDTVTTIVLRTNWNSLVVNTNSASL